LSRNRSWAITAFGDVVVDRRADEDDSILQQARVDVVDALAATGLLDHGGDGVVGGGFPHGGAHISSGTDAGTRDGLPRVHVEVIDRP
jgi:hypothetical protein